MTKDRIEQMVQHYHRFTSRYRQDMNKFKHFVFFLYVHEKYSYSEIAELFGLCKQRIGQIVTSLRK